MKDGEYCDGERGDGVLMDGEDKVDCGFVFGGKWSLMGLLKVNLLILVLVMLPILVFVLLVLLVFLMFVLMFGVVLFVFVVFKNSKLLSIFFLNAFIFVSLLL